MSNCERIRARGPAWVQGGCPGVGEGVAGAGLDPGSQVSVRVRRLLGNCA
jgi:hypothetical protein